MMMKCSRAQEYISEYIDGILESGREETLRNHLEACAECRAFLGDFRTISGEAQNLEKLLPPDDVWLNIRARLREERSGARAEDSERRSLFSFMPSRLHFAVATAMGAVVVIASLLFYSQPWNRGMPVEHAAMDRQTIEKLNEAEWHYQKAVEALTEVVTTQEGKLDPGVAEVFRVNLEIVNVSLEACRQAVQRAPRDLDAQFALMESYKQKVQLLTDWALAQRSIESEESGISS
jgi:anti-sigma factor RsiW